MRRKLVLIIGSLLLLFAVVFVWLFVSGTTPAAVRQRLAERTGAQVELAEVDRLWFGPGVEVHGLKLAASAYTLEVKDLELRLAFLPLLLGRVQPKSVAVSDVQLTLPRSEALGGSSGAKLDVSGLPLDADWRIDRLSVSAPVDGATRPLFYIKQASLGWSVGRGRRLEVTGGATEAADASFHFEGEVRNWEKAIIPDGGFQVQFEQLPAQPLVAYFTGDQRLLGTATLDGLLKLEMKDGAAEARGTVNVSADDTELLRLTLLAHATPDLLVLESVNGQLAGNNFEASGRAQDWLTSRRKSDFKLALPEAHLEKETLSRVRATLGRPALGFAESVRGPFAATLHLATDQGQERLTGEVDLKGMIYRGKNLPPVTNIRGRLRLAGTQVTLVGVTGRALETPFRLSGGVRGAQLNLRLTSAAIPLARASALLGGGLPVTNLGGQLDLDVSVKGTAVAPNAAGVATVRGGGFDVDGIAVRDIEGEAKFNMSGAHWEDVTGRAGGCSFRSAGHVVPARWQETLSGRAILRQCELSEMVRLGAQLEPANFAGLRPEDFAGTGTLAASYDEGRWRARLNVREGKWSPPWLRLPLENIRLHAHVNANEVRVRELSARLGNSPLELEGSIALAETVSPWQFEMTVKLTPEDTIALLPPSWGPWLRLPGALDGGVELTGSRSQGLAVRAQLTTAAAEDGAGDPPGEASGRIRLQGTWNQSSFDIGELQAELGSSRVEVQGQVPLQRDGSFNLHAHLPSGSRLADLLTFVQVPPAVGPVEGAVGGDVAVSGPRDAIAWAGTINLEGVRLPELLTEPVTLTGKIDLSNQGAELQNIEVRQPRGAFALSGTLRPAGESALALRGPWANLDRLLGQLGKSRLHLPRSEFLERHPVRVAVAVEKVKFLDLIYTDVNGEFTQEEGGFALRVPRFGLSSGHGQLHLQTDPEGNRLQAHLELTEVPVETLLVDLLKLKPTVRGVLSVQADLSGPLAGPEDFLRDAQGQVDYQFPRGATLERGTLPERLFAVAVLLDEGLYGFGLNRLARVIKPRGLRGLKSWTGRLELGGGKVQVVESRLSAPAYDVDLTGALDLGTKAFQMHGDGNFHPGWEFDISLRAIVSLFAHLLQVARRQHGKPFEFDVAGRMDGPKSVQNFRFKD